MPIPYANITKAVMLRANQTGDGANAADIETKFADVLPTAIEGVEVPLSALKLSVLASEKSVAEIIAFSSIDLYRQALYGRSDDFISGEEIGILGDANYEFLGSFGNVRDTVTSDPLTEKPPQDIARMNRLYADGVLAIQPYHFHKSGNILLHTRDVAYVEGCLWSYDLQSDEYDLQDGDTAGFSPLPQACEVPWMCHILANLPQEGWYVSESEMYRSRFQEWKSDVQRGIISAPTLLDTTSSSKPVAN